LCVAVCCRLCCRVRCRVCCRVCCSVCCVVCCVVCCSVRCSVCCSRRTKSISTRLWWIKQKMIISLTHTTRIFPNTKKNSSIIWTHYHAARVKQSLGTWSNVTDPCGEISPGDATTLLSPCRVCCSVLQCVAVCCSVLQCVAMCCSLLSPCGVCCSVLQSPFNPDSSDQFEIQPIAFVVSFNLNLEYQSHWSLFNRMWQKRPRELDHHLLKFETNDTPNAIGCTIVLLSPCGLEWKDVVLKNSESVSVSTVD